MGKGELLTFGLVIAGFLAFNFFMRWAARRARALQEAEQAQQADAPSATDDEPAEVIWGREAQPAAQAPAPAAAPPREQRVEPAPVFRSRKGLRHAIVVMTVLGPCRALGPYDLNQDGRTGSRSGASERLKSTEIE